MSSWYIYAKKADFKRISEKFGIDPVIARILRNRDIISDGDIEYFLHAGLDDLYDERLIPDLEKAASALFAAVKSGRHIRIVGDYDIDGVCATYILLKGLRSMGANVDHRIPDRISDGYGININIISEAAADHVDMILTCDNGIAAIEESRRAAELHMDMIVTDHHNVRKDEDGNDILPEALAVADVKRSDSKYPFSEICGAVTAWKLIKLLYEMDLRPADEWLRFLDFAALATVGDIMSLKGENRVIVKEGLKKISAGSDNLGLRTLIDELELNGKQISTYHVGFVIGPCINAGGRLETAESALRLFLSEDKSEAEILAGHLRMLNAERKEMTEKGTEEGVRIVEESLKKDKVLVVYIPDLHESLAGIVAGRLKEKYYRPCFVITGSRDGLKGSGRSIESYDMFEALCEADSFLTKYGGHRMAAGLSLKEENLGPFRTFLNEHTKLREEDFVKKVWIDDPTPLHYITGDFVKSIEALEPFGNGFEKPLFADRNLKPAGLRVLGKSGNALKLRLIDAAGISYDGIMFGDAAHLKKELIKAQSIDILYSPSFNSFRGRETIQAVISDFRVRA